jgi:hypothetical protein
MNIAMYVLLKIFTSDKSFSEKFSPDTFQILFPGPNIDTSMLVQCQCIPYNVSTPPFQESTIGCVLDQH